jgi:pimeloyl-ACP methyl ester carboxylesterase
VWRWTLRALVGVGGLFIVAALAGAAYQSIMTRRDLAGIPPPGRLVDVGGHRLHLWCSGVGEPTVILEAGLGGSAVSWGFVQPEVATFTRVCSYDRAGIGYSDPGPSPRTARRLAGELAQLLEQSGITGPVVLAGASFGGFVVRVLASEQEHRAAGLVLVDASHEDQAHDVPGLARFVPILAPAGVFRLLGVSFSASSESLPPAVRGFARATKFRAAGYEAAAREIMHVQESAAEVRNTRRPLTIPVIVVSGARGADATWRDLQRDQVRLSPRGCQVVAHQSGHVVPIEQPRIVVDAIRAIVDTTRGRAVTALCGTRRVTG